MKKGRKTRPQRDDTPTEIDAKAVELIKASGILNPDAKLDGLLRLAQELEPDVSAARPRFHIFIFREVVFVKCPTRR